MYAWTGNVKDFFKESSRARMTIFNTYIGVHIHNCYTLIHANPKKNFNLSDQPSDLVKSKWLLLTDSKT